ncbi:N-terminal kinase-like protein [Heterostelium album PN500]|uniref:N-terminal kinase-like protein n=1 Tax=Heterostelium pallidum (strain ATCC 26659 / Pp 5 / PN500) TaxID=670386 RepID=D3BSK8_HETP5|nr:N-terminal kinase-like protein [Heterostelium album PN500]EFA75473.1 N-terminal kinase-like protein [Heterostelium album PN500]|eukprot:XP_020427607.1 N-terminal kinase-like protein [Heterostelium album PN500]
MGQGLSAFQQFPYQIGTPITSYQGKSIWTLSNGTKKDDGSAVSIFTFDVKKNPTKLEVAKNGFKRAKTIRHPNFLTYLDGLETDTNIYIVTEPVTPLDESIEDIRKYENAISWGVYQITKALSFINNDVNLTHGNVNTTTVFVTKSGDWKLGGLELICDVRDMNPFLKQHGDQVPVKYKPPEVTKGQWSQVNTAPSYAIDSWMLGCLIYECYNGPMSKSEDVRDLSQIPKPVHQSYQKCFANKIENRLNPTKFLECPYFQNIFVETCVFLENITLKDNFEKETFFK